MWANYESSTAAATSGLVGLRRSLASGGRPIGLADIHEADIGRETPVTAIPLRDAILTSFALAWAGLLTRDFFIHMNPMDPGALVGGPPEYLEAYGCLLSQSRRPTEWGRSQVRVHTPLAGLSKVQIIQQGLGLGVDYVLTVSCRDPSPGGEARERCGFCMRRMQGFEDAGIPDPTRYYARMREAV
jgi:7-cyano-7-deazaguanine synthase